MLIRRNSVVFFSKEDNKTLLIPVFVQMFHNLVFSQQMAKEVKFGAVAAQPYLQKSETLGNDTEMSHEVHLSTILHACFD